MQMGLGSFIGSFILCFHWCRDDRADVTKGCNECIYRVRSPGLFWNSCAASDVAWRLQLKKSRSPLKANLPEYRELKKFATVYSTHVQQSKKPARVVRSDERHFKAARSW